MSAKTTKRGKTAGKGEEETKTEGAQDSTQTCGCMPSGEMSECCGPAMREMMSRWMGQAQAKVE